MPSYVGLIFTKTVKFRLKTHISEVVENFIFYFFVPYTFYLYDAPLWRKNGKCKKSTPKKGGFPPKKGEAAIFWRGTL